MIKNFFNQKNSRRLSVLLSLVLVWNTFFLPYSIVKAEEGAAQEQTVVESPPAPTDSPTPTSAPSAGSAIVTGDAAAASQTDTTVNYTQTETSGTITSDQCDVAGQISCPINQTNQAETEMDTAASANSGQNSTANLQGDSLIDTGNALSGSASQTVINTNIIEATGSAEETDKQANQIIINNLADLNATNSADSISGQNSIEDNRGLAEIVTGDSIATSDQVNIINTNIIGSNFEYFLLPIFGEASGDINLNDVWKALESKFGQDLTALTSANITITIDNQADVRVSATADAVSGQNQTVDPRLGSVITTGNAYASANIVNFINVNFLGSNFLIAVINIFGKLTGDIILPNQDRFLEQTLNNPNLPQTEYSLDDFALVQANVTASADSGSNSQIGQSVQLLTSGDAYAQAAMYNFLNQNLFLSNWFMVFLNNFGFWNGNIISWDDQTARLPAPEAATNYQVDNQNLNNSQQLTKDSQDQGAKVDISNTANIFADVFASAVSGQNTALGGWFSQIITGRAIALANLFNFINGNFIGSRMIFPIINIFSYWTGNLIFAYPILEVQLTGDKQEVMPGDIINYTVHYQNVGYEDARDSKVNINLPEEETIISADGPDYQVNGSTVIFSVGDVRSKQGGSFTFTARVNQPVTKKPSVNLLGKIFSKLVSVVEAAETGIPLTTVAQIHTIDPQSDTSRNSSSFTVYLQTVSQPEDQWSDNDQPANYGTPWFRLEAKNNVGDYVYPGDTITYEVKAVNDGTGTLKNTYVYHTLMFEDQPVSYNQFFIGDISPGSRRKLTFQMVVPAKAPEGSYISYFTASGQAETGETMSATAALVEFLVKYQGLGFVPAVQAKEETGQVLAAAKDQEQIKNANNHWPYLMLVAISMLWFVERYRRKRLELQLKALLERIKSKF